MTWRLRHQLIYLGVFALIFVSIFLVFNYIFAPAPSCFDGRQNQDEAGVDCGGARCPACITETPKNVTVLWTRLFQIRTGTYEAAALVENPNIMLGARSIPYLIKFVDADGLVIATRRGETYALPQSRFLIYESGVVSALRKPTRVALELQPFVWEAASKQELPIRIIKGEQSFGLDRPRYLVSLKNESINAVSNIDVAAVVLDASGNALGVSASHLDAIGDSATQDVTFIWPFAFPQGHSPIHVDVLVRKNPWAAH